MNMSEFDGSRTKGYKAAMGGINIVARLLIAVLIVAALIFFGRMAYSLGYEAFSQKTAAPEGEGHDIVVTITEDMTVSDVWELLQSSGLIDESENAFKLQDILFGLDGKILPGEYVLNTSMTVNEMYQVMSTEPEEEEEE